VLVRRLYERCFVGRSSLSFQTWWNDFNREGLAIEVDFNLPTPLLEQLLIQQAALCWLKLDLAELSYSGTMKPSITLTLGIYWERRLTAAQRRFTRACETLARVRKLSRITPALQFNIATSGGQQVNLTT
jgi:hypothetical protein